MTAINDLIDRVASEYGVTRSEILSRARHDRIAWPRMIAMSLAGSLFGMKDDTTARAFNCSHSNVWYARRSTKRRLEAYPLEQKRVANIATTLK